MASNLTTFDLRLKLFQKKRNRDLLCCNLRGIERETLRVTAAGTISQESHPQELGSALTHPLITTDYSEALLEFITEPFPKIDDLLNQLGNTHSFTAQNLSQGEVLWPSSMPCRLDADNDVPIAQYGTSNVGMMKTIYRRGLGHRYGRKMQAIAGIHFNFSVSDAVWSRMRAEEGSLQTLQDYRAQGYMGLVRNFRRRFWLLLYLMGASPIADKSFVKGRAHDLQTLNERDVYLPKATSLRMGDLGYQSSAQHALYVCYNDVDSYVQTLQKAIVEEYPPYQKIISAGDKDARQQLSSAVLQIENEFYSTIRPKQTTRRGETQLKALKERGVEYIEVRCVDINPFKPLGIDREQIQFLELFLLGCLFDQSPETNKPEYEEILKNQKSVVREGRAPELELQRDGKPLPLKNWATELLDQLEPIAEIMDTLKGAQDYANSLATMRQRVADPSQCPSAKVLDDIQRSGKSFVDWSLSKAEEHHGQYKEMTSDAANYEQFQRLATQSLKEQKGIDEQHAESLDDYIQSYFKQYQETC